MNDQLEEAYDKIKAHEYQKGLVMLEAISEKNARWYYVSGYAHSCMGNNIIAREMLVKAVNMEPDNSDYVRLLNHLGGAVQDYEDSTYGSGLGKATTNKKDDETCAQCCGICCLSSFIDSCDCLEV